MDKQVRLEVDGGINLNNIKAVSDAGADTFVMGSAIFNSDDYKKTISLLIALLHSHFIDAIEASLRGFVLDLEIVESKEDRARGLMYRSSLATNSGMLFKWPETSKNACG